MDRTEKMSSRLPAFSILSQCNKRKYFSILNPFHFNSVLFCFLFLILKDVFNSYICRYWEYKIHSYIQLVPSEYLLCPRHGVMWMYLWMEQVKIHVLVQLTFQWRKTDRKQLNIDEIASKAGKKDRVNWGVGSGCCFKWGGQGKLHQEADTSRVLEKKENHVKGIASPTKILSQ